MTTNRFGAIGEAVTSSLMNLVKKVFNKKVKYNAQSLNLSSTKNENEICEKLLDNDNVVNVTLSSKIKFLCGSADLGFVILIIIVSSGSLAFVVLYNLININISERIKEISTIKVLGFYDNEVAMYIFRENIILIIISILVGYFLGNLLYKFCTSTVEMDNLMMIPTVYIDSYLIAALLTLLFALSVMIVMYKKLKNINMIDTLKSVE